MSCCAPASAQTGEHRNGLCLGDLQGRNLFMCPAGAMPCDTQPCWGVFDGGGLLGHPGSSLLCPAAAGSAPPLRTPQAASSFSWSSWGSSPQQGPRGKHSPSLSIQELGSRGGRALPAAAASPVLLLPECCYQHGLWKLALPAGYFRRQHVMQAAPCSLCKGAPSSAPSSFTSPLSWAVGSAHSATSRTLLELWDVCVCVFLVGL